MGWMLEIRWIKMVNTDKGTSAVAKPKVNNDFSRLPSLSFFSFLFPYFNSSMHRFSSRKTSKGVSLKNFQDPVFWAGQKSVRISLNGVIFNAKTVWT